MRPLAIAAACLVAGCDNRLISEAQEAVAHDLRSGFSPIPRS